ncbi:MAG: D-alanine--D-alanine ligase [Alphaproteobacteria bacterium]|nr:D-alanine--D-alanine ligase [Alphaproteobacteria bacterium]
MKSKKIAVLMGGWSSEREVSLSTGAEVIKALTEIGYDVKPIDVERNLPKLLKELEEVKPEVIFNALHGVGGEDGVIQGVLEMLQIPYTHCSVTSSAIAMDKILSRKIFQYIGIATPPWKVISFEQLKKEHPMEFPYVVKPIGEGSSRGVTLVFNKQDYQRSIQEWTFGEKVLIEKFIPGREIQVAVLDDEAIGAIEIKPYEGFYDYTAKYTPGKAKHLMPAPISPEAYQEVLELALKAHKVLGCHGATRSDFRYDDTNESPTFYLLELNTQPGMTSLSLVPEIAAHAGISFKDLLEKKIKAARCHQ